jgi:hypothetical protein
LGEPISAMKSGQCGLHLKSLPEHINYIRNHQFIQS